MFKKAIEHVSPRNEDGTVNVFVETPKGSRHKYNIDEHGLVKIALELPEGVSFPFSFGFVPNTVAPDGDALDILLVTAGQVPAGALIAARVVGVLKMENDEDGEMLRNDRVVAVATMSRVYDYVETLEDLQETFVWDAGEFFETYNRMIDRPFNLIGRGDRDEAEDLLARALDSA